MERLSFNKVKNGIYVKELYSFNDGLLTKKNDKYIIDSYLLFEHVIKLGEKLVNEEVSDLDIIEYFKEYGLPVTGDLLGYKKELWIDRIRELSKNIYWFISISSLCNTIIAAKNFFEIKFEKLYIYLNNIDWITRFNDSFESNRFSIDDIYNFLLNPKTISYDNKDHICSYIKNALIRYIDKQYKAFPITISIISNLNEDDLNIERGFFRTCDSILGLIYYETLNHIVPNKINTRYFGCAYCGNLFIKIGNTKYCKTCRINGIPEWIKSQKYEHSEKGKETRSKRKKQN